ncbi:KRI1 family protein [Aspergillus stella-maris]|uniref:KRI1 family protein n=1 Tax=Aspergillus stella-maris TaxID=1810926 RepID=UPI003CCCD03F
MEPPAKKSRKLLEDDSSSDSGDDAGGVSLGDFKINEEYARRFEHNKRREEKAQLEAKLGKDDEEEESSSEDEDEDDDAELATEAVDAEILETIKAIRSKDPRVYDKQTKFFTALDENGEPQKREEKAKSMTLRDYHRENLLSGANLADEATDAPKTYAQEQRDLKSAIVKEMHAVADGEESDSDEEDEDEGFLVRKSAPEPLLEQPAAAQLDIENADKDPEMFLSNFMSSRAWLQNDKSKLQPFESDDEEEDERAEAWEEAYNFRFEDPSKLNNKLVTHARDLTNKQSVRREEVSGRKKLREAARSKKEEEKKQRETEKNRLRKLKAAELQDKVDKIKEVAGLRGSEITDEDWVKFLDGAWDDKDWENEMQKRFSDEYYAEDDARGSGDEDEGKKKRPKKPTWDDDIDINDLVPDFENDEQPTVELSDVEMGDDDAEGGNKKSKAQEKRDQKREARKDKMRIEEALDRNMDIDLALLPGSSKRNDSGFRYRETSPQAFGLSALDILMADDAHLNQFAGLKKYASFREDDKKKRDQKRLGKKARLRQWRKDTFGDEEGPREFKFGGEKPSTAEQEDAEDNVDIREGEPWKKKRKRSKKN